MKIFSLFVLLLFSSTLLSDETTLNLSQNERAWIEKNKTIKVASELSWPPFDYVENGIPLGMSIDYIKHIANHAGLKIQFVNGYTWPELIELFKNKEIDVLPAFYKNEEREKYTLYTKPYFQAKVATFTTIDNPTSIDKLHDVKVGMEQSDGSINIVKQQFPNLHVIENESNIDLLRQLATHKIDVLIGTPHVILQNAKRLQLTNIMLNDYIDTNESHLLDASIHIGVRRDLPILFSIINKGMNNISEKEHIALQEKWTPIHLNSKTDWEFVVQIMAMVFVVIIFLVLHSKRLQATVEKKTAELKQLNNELEKKVHERTLELEETNKKLHTLANMDSLTKIRNRRSYFIQSEKLLEQSILEKKEFFIAMIDIDHFKKINDTYGHAVGDKVLIELCRIVNNILSNEIFGRIGGEEFCITFYDRREEDVYAIAEQIRIACAENTLAIDGDEIKFTVSLGLSRKNSFKNIDEIILSSDAHLYCAKKRGRNRLETHS